MQIIYLVVVVAIGFVDKFNIVVVIFSLLFSFEKRELNMIELNILFVLIVLVLVQCIDCSNNVITLRGGLVPQASEPGAEYYEKFTLDYGGADNKRIAGAMRGFISSGVLPNLPESDPFMKWLNNHLDKGMEPISGRIKPFYAADFGSKSDLNKGENPKIIIVQRKLKGNKDGILLRPTNEIDVEVRQIKNPILKHRCNFAVRYIVPNRINIIKIMESKGQFSSEIEVEKGLDGISRTWAKMTFKPRLFDRLIGKKNLTLKRQMDTNKIFGKS